MKKNLLTLYCLVILCSNISAQDNNKIETIAVIEILNEISAKIDNDTISLNSVHIRVNRLLEDYNLEPNNFPSVTLVVNPSISENSIENIKYQIRSTPIQLINLQRKVITDFNGIEITQNVLDQYNSLINYWNSLNPEDRFYRESDLDFVEIVALNMTIDQRIRNEKLPGYLPFVKEEKSSKTFSNYSIESENEYLFVYKTDTIEKNQAVKQYKNKAFKLKRRLIDENKIIIVELSDN